MTALRFVLAAVGVVGAIVFGAGFVASFANPEYVERVGREVIRQELERRTQEKIAAIDAEFLSQRAAHLIRSNAERVAEMKRFLSTSVPERVGAIVERMQQPDCGCRDGATIVRDYLRLGVLSLERASERLDEFIRARYLETAEKLTREFRIFTGTNAVVFALLALSVFVRRQAGIHLVPAAAVLLVAAATTAYLYVFQQNWIHTILFGDYVGLAYVAYLAAAFALLCDVLFNRARITVRIINGVSNVVGSAVSAAPC